jgi:hypothetical protein
MSRVGQTAEAALLGAGASTLFWWQQFENDRNNRLRQLQNDNRSTQQQIDDLTTSGDWYRLTTGPVRDIITGIATTMQIATAPTPIPNPSVTARPDLSAGNNVPFMQWPPVTSQYDASGNPETFTELMTAGQVLTYQEPRAWLQGLTQSKVPGTLSLIQIFTAAQGLSLAASAQSMTAAQYQQAFANLFQGINANANPSAPPLHYDITKGPTAAANVPAVSTPLLPSAPNTDAAPQFQLSIASGAIPAGTTLLTVTFGTPYNYVNQNGVVTPFAPPVICTNPGFTVGTVTSQGFTVVNVGAITGGFSGVVNFIVAPGVPTK